MTHFYKPRDYKKTLQHLTLWGCLANTRYRKLGAVASVALTVGMVPQVSLASEISEAEFLAQLQAVEDSFDLGKVKRNEKLIELSQQGNIVADMTLYRYITRGDTIDYSPHKAKITQAIRVLNNSSDDEKGLISLFKGFNYKDGNLNINQDYDKAFTEYQKSASSNNINAMSNLGIMYMKGKGTKLDYSKSMEWFLISAEKGNSNAMNFVGLMYEEGQGVSKSEATAKKWYIKAAKAGNMHGMYNLANYYAHGKGGLSQDYNKAMNLYKSAADLGHVDAMINIGVLYYNGLGVSQAYSKAMQWYNKAADAGDAGVMNNIGYIYAQGLGVPKDSTKAIKWYKKAAIAGNSTAMNNLGMIYRDGEGVQKNNLKAIKWYKAAINKDNNYASPYIALGYMYEKGLGVNKNLDIAKENYQKAINIGNNPYAFVKMGELYVKLEDYKKAVTYFNRAAEADSDLGMNFLAQSYENGSGINRDYNQAAYWYAKSLSAKYDSHASYNEGDTFETSEQWAKRKLENLLATNKITDPAIRKQVEAIFAKPPLITWQTSPPSTINNDTLNLSVLLTDQGGGIGDVRVLLDGVAVDQSSRGLTRQVNQTTRDFTLSIPKGSHTITVEAYPGDNLGVTSKVIKQITSTYAPIQKPKLHAVIIGIDTYQNPDLKLNYAAKDASAIYNTLNKQVGSIYDKGHISLLNTARSTSKANIISKVNEIKANADMGDVFVFYAASHGYNFPDTGYHLFTSDVGATSSNKVSQTGINAEDLQDLLAQVNTDKKLILLDTCDSGGSIDAGQLIASRGLDDQMVIERMQRKAGATVIMASSDKQKALEGYQGHGVFTYGLLQAFNGAGDTNKDGYMKTNELSSYIEDEIPTIAKKAFNQPQYPTASTVGNGFEFKVF